MHVRVDNNIIDWFRFFLTGIIETAEKFISDSLAAETNLYKWFQKAIPILSTTATSGVLAQFAKIIDMKSATINFNQDKTIKARISLAAAFGAALAADLAAAFFGAALVAVLLAGAALPKRDLSSDLVNCSTWVRIPLMT